MLGAGVGQQALQGADERGLAERTLRMRGRSHALR